MFRDPMPLLPAAPAPPIVRKAKLYAGALTVLYALCAAGGVLLLTAPLWGFDDPAMRRDSAEIFFDGVLMLVFGVALGVVSGLAWSRAERRTKGTWTLHLVLQALGLTSCCCLPFALPLLLQWNKPEVKQWYGL